MNGIVGKKLGMTRIFDAEGRAIPVTVIEAGPCPVLQVRTNPSGRTAVQIGFGALDSTCNPLALACNARTLSERTCGFGGRPNWSAVRIKTSSPIVAGSSRFANRSGRDPSCGFSRGLRSPVGDTSNGHQRRDCRQISYPIPLRRHRAIP